jgi:hypothetical protein
MCDKILVHIKKFAPKYKFVKQVGEELQNL